MFLIWDIDNNDYYLDAIKLDMYIDKQYNNLIYYWLANKKEILEMIKYSDTAVKTHMQVLITYEHI